MKKTGTEPQLRTFTYRTQSHFDDLDAQWILHHSRQIRYVERAQQALFDRVMGMQEFDPYKFPDLNVVVKRLEVDYLKPLKGVRPFQIEMRVLRLRGAGMTTSFEFKSEDGGDIYTRGIREVCKLSIQTWEPELWTDDFRTRFESWMASPA